MRELDNPTTITIGIDPSNLGRVTDSHLVMLWHVAQANPAPHADEQAGALVAKVSHEIIRRWLASTEPEMYHHQERSYYWNELCRFASFRNGVWSLDPEKVSKLEQSLSEDGES